MPPAKTPKKSAVKAKNRPTLDDVVEQLISLQGFGTSQDTSLLQIGDSTSHDDKLSSTFGPLIGPIIGVDEAGRGCLAGPVVAAAVILPTCPVISGDTPKNMRSILAPDLESLGLAGLADSKKLTEAQRDALAPLIRQHAVAWGLGVVWPTTIDKVNILQATFLAMARAVNNIRMQATLMLIDGNKTIPAHAFAASQAFKRQPMTTTAATIDNTTTRQHAVVGGDDIIPAISAASILAKTYRDKLMVTFDKQYPNYGFAKHKGYGTKDHLAALVEHGPCSQHRMTFRGVVQDTEKASDTAKKSASMQDITQATATPLLLC